MPTSDDNKMPDPQSGGRYERNTDGTLKTIHQTAERDTAQYVEDKAKRQDGDDASTQQPAQAGGTPNTNAQE